MTTSDEDDVGGGVVVTDQPWRGLVAGAVQVREAELGLHGSYWREVVSGNLTELAKSTTFPVQFSERALFLFSTFRVNVGSTRFRPANFLQCHPGIS